MHQEEGCNATAGVCDLQKQVSPFSVTECKFVCTATWQRAWQPWRGGAPAKVPSAWSVMPQGAGIWPCQTKPAHNGTRLARLVFMVMVLLGCWRPPTLRQHLWRRLHAAVAQQPPLSATQISSRLPEQATPMPPCPPLQVHFRARNEMANMQVAHEQEQVEWISRSARVLNVSACQRCLQHLVACPPVCWPSLLVPPCTTCTSWHCSGWPATEPEAGRLVRLELL